MREGRSYSCSPTSLPYPLSLHDALPILATAATTRWQAVAAATFSTAAPALIRPHTRSPRPASSFRSSPTRARAATPLAIRSEEHTSELQSLRHLVCRLLLEK